MWARRATRPAACRRKLQKPLHGRRCRRERISHRWARCGGKAPGGGLSALGRKDFQKARSEWGEKGRRALRLAGGNRRTLCVGALPLWEGFPPAGAARGKGGRRLDGGDVELKALLLNASPKNNGNTARLLELIGDAFQKKGMETQTLCLGDLHYAFCKGCRSCYQTAECVQHDDVQLVLEQMEQADLIAIASPDYWGGITGQLKAFIDRCTPYSPAHQPHAALSMGKAGDQHRPERPARTRGSARRSWPASTGFSSAWESGPWQITTPAAS